MKNIALKARDLIMTYLKWGWPLVLLDAALEIWLGRPQAPLHGLINGAAFAWILCAPIAPLSLLLDRTRRERAMARLCGLREGDERERMVTGEAARATLLLGLSLQMVLLVMSLVNVQLSWTPHVPKGEKRGLLSVGMGFSSVRHLDPFGHSSQPKRDGVETGGFLLAPSTFPVLALLILIQLAAFKALAARRYEGNDA